MKNYLTILCLILFLSNNTYSQDSSLAYKIKNIKKTYYEGGINQNTFDIRSIKNKYKNSIIYFNCKNLTIKNKTRIDKYIIGNRHSINRVIDDDLTRKYPGDEIICSAKDSTRYIGETFLKLLKVKKKSLVYYDLYTNKNIDTCIKLIEISKDQTALFFINDFYIVTFIEI